MTRTVSALALVGTTLAAFTACSEQGFSPKVENDVNTGQIIEVTPARLDFGTLSDGEEETKFFQVKNIGTDELHVTDIEITGGSSFMLLSTETDFRLPPDAASSFDVLFTPLEADTVNGVATVFSDDPENPEVPVQLVGVGAVPSLRIDPDPYDFGIDYIGCGDDLEVTLTNVGTDPLVIDSIEYSSRGMLSMDELPFELPLTLAPEASATLDVAFMPDSEDAAVGTLTVLSNDPRGEVTSEHTGTGQYADWKTDIFAVPVDPPVDIIFAVDRSCSMDDDAASLASNFLSFISTIETVTAGWRIGVVTGDNGCFNSGWIESTTPNYQTLFTQAVQSNNWNRYTESLLTLARNAIQAAVSGCNAGFLRPGAITHVIMVTDEPEQSVESWSSLVSQMQGYYADPAMLKLSAVAGDYPTGCGTAEAGTGYYEAVSATGGVFLSICSNWSTNVDVLADISIEGLVEFELSATPDPSSITVFVDGVQWLIDWHYDATLNQIVFDTELSEGAAIEVNYGVLVTCD